MSSDDDFNYEDADEESQNNLECQEKFINDETNVDLDRQIIVLLQR